MWTGGTSPNSARKSSRIPRTATVLAGMTDNQTDKKEIEGEVVLSELKDKKWTHILEDTKPNEKQLKELKNYDDPENDDELYPAQKVKVGHAWDIEPSAFKKLLGSKVTDPSGKGKSKFLRTEKVGDDLCAVIESEIDIKGKMKDDDGNILTIEMKGKVLNHRSMPWELTCVSTRSGHLLRRCGAGRHSPSFIAASGRDDHDQETACSTGTRNVDSSMLDASRPTRMLTTEHGIGQFAHACAINSILAYISSGFIDG